MVFVIPCPVLWIGMNIFYDLIILVIKTNDVLKKIPLPNMFDVH